MAFRTQKISQMTPKGSDLEATDLIEVSTIESGSYVTRSITGQELIDAIPAPSVDWGDIGGTLSDQTDLNTALSGKVPTSRTLTINGTTQDLSADRTFTISTGITIGTTAITSGTVGRLLFEGTGNVVQESANLTFDSATTKLQLGILTPTATTTPAVLSLGATYGTNAVGSTSNIKLKIYDDNTAGGVYGFGLTSNLLEIHSPNTTGIFSGGGATRTQVFSVNTAGSLFGSTTLIATTQPFLVALGGTYGSNTAGSVANLKLKILGSNAFSSLTDYGLGISAGLFEFSASDAFGFFTGNSLTRTERMRIFAGGNIGINTTTDAGFRLDVNGNSRVRGAGATGSTNAFTVQNSSGSSALSITNGLTTIVHGDLQLENTVLYWSSGSQIRNISNGVLRISDSTNANFTRLQFGGGTTSYPSLQRSGSALAVMDATGTALTNLLVGTTTDAGFRLDVNGTARVSGNLTLTGGSLLMNNNNIYIARGTGGASDGMEIRALSSGTDAVKVTTSSVSISSSGGITYQASAQLAVDSTTRGFLPPRMTTTQKNAIATPATGLQIFDTTLNRPCFYDGTSWITL